MLEDLATLPFLSPRRVVVIRDADAFVTAHRERLEVYLEHPAPTGTLVLTCRSFPRTTRLSKAALAVDGRVIECKSLGGRALVDFAVSEARARGKRMEPATAARLISLVGNDAGLLAGEIDKLALYAGERATLTENDINELVGQSREEKIFAAMDAAALGRLRDALQLWHQVLATDPESVFKVIGGMAWKTRQWLNAQRLAAAGASAAEIAPRVGMWGREHDLQLLLRRLSAATLRRLLAAIAELDSQAKLGVRSIETGVELTLTRLASIR